jgi:hypothetical protein
MSDKVTIFYQADSCETCHFSQREQYGKFRCKENTEIVFVQNKDIGVPADCPFRKKGLS